MYTQYSITAQERNFSLLVCNQNAKIENNEELSGLRIEAKAISGKLN